ncbi:unnamed protein product [Tenebrio molitor]|nr:unnamed protein product [Tenebrio molitor]
MRQMVEFNDANTDRSLQLIRLNETKCDCIRRVKFCRINLIKSRR